MCLIEIGLFNHRPSKSEERKIRGRGPHVLWWRSWSIHRTARVELISELQFAIIEMTNYPCYTRDQNELWTPTPGSLKTTDIGARQWTSMYIACFRVYGNIEGRTLVVSSPEIAHLPKLSDHSLGTLVPNVSHPSRCVTPHHRSSPFPLVDTGKPIALHMRRQNYLEHHCDDESRSFLVSNTPRV